MTAQVGGNFGSYDGLYRRHSKFIAAILNLNLCVLGVESSVSHELFLSTCGALFLISSTH